MNSQSRNDRFDTVLMTIAETYDCEFSEASAKIWEASLEKYDIAEIERALVAHISDTEKGEFKPRPASIIRHIEGTMRTRSENAAAILVHAKTQANDRTGVCFADPIINAAVAQTHGWPAAYFCMRDADKIDDYLEQFKRAYERLSVGVNPHPAYLPGRDNDESFVVIGDEAAVDHVVATGYNPKKPLLAAYASVKQITN